MIDLEILFRVLVISFAIIGMLCVGGFFVALGIFIRQGKGGLKEFFKEEW